MVLSTICVTGEESISNVRCHSTPTPILFAFPHISCVMTVSPFELNCHVRGLFFDKAYLLELLVLQIAPNHHLEDDEQLPIADVAVSVNVVDFEREPKLLLFIALGAERG